MGLFGNRWNDLGLSYEAALHGMQSAVAFEMNKRSQPTEPKHLRVGINSAMVDHSALANLMIKKGIITEEEYLEELRLAMNHELDRYQKHLDLTGRMTFR